MCLLEGRRQITRRALLELAQANIRKPRLEDGHANARDTNRGPLDHEGLGSGPALAPDLDHHLGATWTAHELDGLEQVHVLGGDAAVVLRAGADRDNLILRLDPGLRRRGAIDRGNDHDEAIALGDLDPEAFELTLGVELDLLVEVGREVARVRIQNVQHALESALDQRVLIDVIHVVLLDEMEHVRQQRQFPIIGPGEALQVPHAEEEKQRHSRGDRERADDAKLAHHFPSCALDSSQPCGSTGLPSRRISK